MIKKMTADKLYDVWQKTDTHNFRYFYDRIKSQDMDFYALSHDGTIIGELYALKTSPDPDEAGGQRIYLLAFRVQKDFQGQGKGKALMFHVLEDLEKQGYEEFTIGVDPEDYQKLRTIYERWGFDQVLKYSQRDLHCFDENNEPIWYNNPSVLLMRRSHGR